MATTASIAARRQRAIERIATAIGFTPQVPRSAPEFRHAAELEQIADYLDPDGKSPPVSGGAGIRKCPIGADVPPDPQPDPQPDPAATVAVQEVETTHERPQGQDRQDGGGTDAGAAVGADDRPHRRGRPARA